MVATALKDKSKQIVNMVFGVFLKEHILVIMHFANYAIKKFLVLNLCYHEIRVINFVHSVSTDIRSNGSSNSGSNNIKDSLVGAVYIEDPEFVIIAATGAWPSRSTGMNKELYVSFIISLAVDCFV